MARWHEKQQRIAQRRTQEEGESRIVRIQRRIEGMKKKAKLKLKEASRLRRLEANRLARAQRKMMSKLVREQTLQLRLEAELAEATAQKLLCQQLPPALADEFTRYMQVSWPSKLQRGKRYVIQLYQPNVFLFEGGRKVGSYCFHSPLNSAPPTDELLSKLWLIQADEEHFLELVKGHFTRLAAAA